MSTGEVTPKPSAVATATTWTSRISSILIATVIAGQQFGLVTPKNAESIKSITDKLTPIADKIETIANDKKVPDMSVVIDLADQVKKLSDQLAADKKKQDEQITPKPQPTPVDPVPTPTPDQQRIADMEAQIRKLLDELAKKHEPPPPVPVPTPSASLKVLDSTGKEITQPIESGRQFKVASTTAGKWSVTSESPTTDYDVTEYPDHLVCVLRNGAKLSISHATEAPLTLTAIMVKCQDAPRPPPTPVDPVDPDKPKLGMRVLMLYESSQNHSAKQDLILNSFTTGKINDAVVNRVTKDADGRPNWRRWDVDLNVDTSSTMGKLFAETKPKAVQRGLPALVIAMGDDATIFQIPLDANEDQVIAAIEGAK